MSFPKLKGWITERYDVADEMRDIARHKLVPVHSREIWYYTGGAVLFLFIVQFLTGIALAFYYVPYFEKAHESVVEIVTKLNMGWFSAPSTTGARRPRYSSCSSTCSPHCS